MVLWKFWAENAVSIADFQYTVLSTAFGSRDGSSLFRGNCRRTLNSGNVTSV